MLYITYTWHLTTIFIAYNLVFHFKFLVALLTPYWNIIIINIMKRTTFITYLTNNIYFEFEWKIKQSYFVHQHIL